MPEDVQHTISVYFLFCIKYTTVYHTFYIHEARSRRKRIMMPSFSNILLQNEVQDAKSGL